MRAYEIVLIYFFCKCIEFFFFLLDCLCILNDSHKTKRTYCEDPGDELGIPRTIYRQMPFRVGVVYMEGALCTGEGVGRLYAGESALVAGKISTKYNEYSGTSCKATSLDVRLRWSLTGSFTYSNLTDGGTNRCRWLLTRGGRSGRF